MKDSANPQPDADRDQSPETAAAKELTLAKARIADLSRLLSQSREREARLTARAEHLQQTLNNLYRSTSWRITAPVRRLANLLRGRPAKGSGTDRAAALRLSLGRDLDTFLKSDATLTFPPCPDPDISVVIVVFNQAALTYGCLSALAQTRYSHVQVIIVDNASTDDTEKLLGRVRGVEVLRQSSNLHFLKAANIGAAGARGRAILFLNNDAFVSPNALAFALETLESRADIGAVAAKIILPDGRLQEAGSILWNDGTAVGYGRGDDPEAPAYQFRREVDYGSGAFLLVRRDLFQSLGGLDPIYEPAYYEETDFCMRLRSAGYRIIYDPRVSITHMEFGSAATREEAISLQQRNHRTFVARHRDRLQQFHKPPGTRPLLARSPDCPRLLILDDRVPFPALGAGYPRAAKILEAAAAGGWFVTYYPLVYVLTDWDSIYETFSREVEFMIGAGETGLGAFLAERIDYYDTILISRPHNMARFLAALPKGAKLPRIIYDAEALIAPREAARLALAGRPLSPDAARRGVEQELALTRIADCILAVSPSEAEQFRNFGKTDVRVLGHAVAPGTANASAFRRRGLLFVGALDDDPSPNLDSLIWFVGEIMPHLDQLLGTTYDLTIAGRSSAPHAQSLASPRILLVGQVPEIGPFFDAARVFIAPTRFAAGIPHKIHEAAAHGLPVVATGLLARQLGWQDGVELLTADTPQEFARQCARLYSDDDLWQRIRDAALARVTRDCDPNLFESTLLSALNAGAG